MTKKSIIALCSCAVAFVGLLAVATFLDLEISIALANADSVFGQFFNYLGETPAWAGLPVAFVILFQAVNKKNKYYKFLKPAFLVCTFVGFFFFARFIMDEMFVVLKWSYLYMTVFGLVFTVLAIAATAKVDKAVMEKLVVFALLLLVCIVVSQGIVTVLKYVWGRQRFRNLEIGNMPVGSSEGFTPWYKPTFGKHAESNLYNDVLGGKDVSGAYKSFPSGHSAAAGISFAIIILPELFDKLKKYSIWFTVVPSAYTLLVALSRIVNRAHYLSDVLFGATISVACVYTFKYILMKLYAQYNQKQTLQSEDSTLQTESE